MKRPSPGDVLAQHYRLTEVLREGGTSVVFAAEEVSTGKLVAIKWIFPELMREREVSLRLLREAQRNAAITHPNVVDVMEVGRHEDSLFLVMELLHGRPLSEALTEAPFEAHAFVKLMMPVLRGVQAAHQLGVVHGDLKPQNIFLSVDADGQAGQTKVLDFGVSKLTRGSLVRAREVTRAGAVPGTRYFTAPEQLRDARDSDERSDVYGLGVIFYRALSGVYPYAGATPVEVAVRVVGGNAMPLDRRVPRLPPGLSAVVMRALAANPAQRFASVAALMAALEPYTQGPKDSLRALESLSEPQWRRHEQHGGADIRDTPGDRLGGAQESADTARREGSRRSSLAPPPPPPKLRFIGAPRGGSSQGSALADGSVDSRESSVSERRLLGPTRLKLVLPPLPSPEPELDPRDERATSLGCVRWALVLAVALCLGWLATYTLGARW